MNKEIVLGTRGSKLALFQSTLVLNKLKKLFPKLSFSLKTIVTKGDRFLREPLESSIEKGFFVKEIQENLVNRKIDIAVHSLKDLPVNDTDNLCLAAILERGDHRDSFISSNNIPFEKLPNYSVVATSSNRRRAQILKMNSKIKVISIRGNIDTRIKKLDNGYSDGIVLASAGLQRLQILNRVSNYFKDDEMLNAPAQGAIAVETRNSGEIKELVSKLDHQNTRLCVSQERIFLKTLMGGCTSPIGAYAEINKNAISLKGSVLSLDGMKSITKELKREYNNSDIGVDLAYFILNNGGDEILANTRSK